MTNQDHPYKNLPGNSFWKTGVSGLESRKIDLGWQPKSPINRETKIITVGSCFAQHISKSLQENGFDWIDSEPAPAGLRPEDHTKNGYGVFSFRTGNIYTPALLRQWLAWATSDMEPYPEFWVHGGRVFDPFRPTLIEEGFASVVEMLAARRVTLSAIVEAIKQADLFIFTLGLTEAWLNKDGTVYPMCPGTVRGKFSADIHLFHNYDVNEVVHDLNSTFDELRGINPNLRFLLTVSPVPLTATASGQHVLTATTYSKSVLRAAAGQLFHTRVDTDYFPSYELITAPTFKGQFFEQNQRQISSRGVAFVMEQFFASIGVNVKTTQRKADNGDAIHPVLKYSSPFSWSPLVVDGFEPRVFKSPINISTIPSKISTNNVIGNEVCDDIALDAWSNKLPDVLNEPPNILLIGDSHMGMLSKTLSSLGVRHAGGATMNASDWHAMRFDVDNKMVFIPHNLEQREKWRITFETMIKCDVLHAANKRVCITNVGQQRNEAYFNGFLNGYLKEIYGAKAPREIKLIDLQNYLLLARRIHLDLVRRFLAMNYQVIVVSDPPVEPSVSETGCTVADAILLDLYKSVGCQVFNARDWIKNLGGLPNNFRSDDAMHGSDDYYRQLQKELFNRFQININ